MKRMLIFLSLIVFAFSYGIAGDKTELKWWTFDSAKVEAAKSKKKILLDVYTNWCKWCKKMDTVTYANPKVMKYLNEKYVVAKINAESQEQVTFEGKKYTAVEFARSLGISGYPTIAFFEPSGKAITLLSTYLDAEQFIKIAKFIGESKYEKMSFQEFEKNYKD